MRTRESLLFCALIGGALAALDGASTVQAQTSPRAPGGSDPAVIAPVADRVRELFPPARGWFRLVEGARFSTDVLGRAVPDYASLTHPRVRREDAAGHTVLPAFPQEFSSPHRVALGTDPLFWVEVAPLDAWPSRLRIERGLAVYPDAYPDTDVLYKATPTHVDEYLLLRAPSAPSRWRFALRRSPALARARVVAGALEVLDAQGRARLRASPPFAVDSLGQRRNGAISLVDGRMELSIDLRGLRFPVLVDPDWSPTGDMAYGRFYHGANVLPDGSVLATGGCSASVCSGDLTIPGCRTAVATAEVLDLATRTWSRAADDPQSRFFHVSQSLRDGSVLVAGGCLDSECNSASDTTQLFAARERAFSAGPALSSARAGIASALLRDGTVLLAGGAAGATGSTVVERYDPATRALRRVASMSTGRGRAAVTVLNDGRVLVVGGCVGMRCERVLDDAEVYDPTTDRWASTGPMSSARGGHFAVTLHDGRVLVGGGCADATCATYLASTDLLDPRTLRFTAGPAMMRPRVGPRAVPLPNGTVMVSQGCQTRTGCDLSNELYDPATGFAMLEPALTIRGFHELVVDMPAQQVVAVGGCQPRTCSWWNETYDISAIRPLPEPGPEPGPEAGVDASADATLATDVVAPPDALAVLDTPVTPPTDASSAADDGAVPPRTARCACSVPGATRSPPSRWWLAAGALGIALVLRRRRRARSSARSALLASTLSCVACAPAAGTDASLDVTPAPDSTGELAARDEAPEAALADVLDALDAPDAQARDDANRSESSAETSVDAAPCVPLRARALGAGWNHVLAIGPSGELFSWGSNGSGQLGLADTRDRRSAAPVASPGAPWRSVAGGARHSCGVREDGTLWCWGVNAHGQLGTGDTRDRLVPTRIGVENNWEEVACGGLHSCGTRAGGALWCWGANPAGQLGTGAGNVDQTAPVRAGELAGWRGLAAKARYNCARRPEGALFCWGDNSDGQLGQGDTTDRRVPVAVSAGTRFSTVRMSPLHTCAVTSEGALYCWGLNDYGQLGQGDTRSLPVPTRVGAHEDWRSLTAGFSHTCGVRSDASLWCWGDNVDGQLGLGDFEQRNAPARLAPIASPRELVAGMGFTCLLGGDSVARCWGDNSSGQLGAANSQRTLSAPTTVCAP